MATIIIRVLGETIVRWEGYPCKSSKNMTALDINSDVIVVDFKTKHDIQHFSDTFKKAVDKHYSGK